MYHSAGYGFQPYRFRNQPLWALRKQNHSRLRFVLLKLIRLKKEIYLVYKEDQSAPRTYTLGTVASRVWKTVSMADQPPRDRSCLHPNNLFSAPSSPRPSSVSASKNTSRDREHSRDGSCSTPHPENTILPSQQEENPPSLAGQFPPSLGADCDHTYESWLQGCKWKLVELDLISLTLTPKWNEEDTPFSWTLVLHMAKFWTQWMLLGQPCWSRRWIWECRPCATKQQGKRTQHSVLHQKHLWERQTSLLCKPLECWISCYL